MRSKVLFIWMLILIGIHGCFEAPWAPVKEPTSFSAGYAEIDITPPIGTALGGFGPPGGFRLATGVHDPLCAQVALFTNDADQSLMLITIDATGYMYEFGDWGPGIQEVCQSIEMELSQIINISAENILVSSSHSESAIDLIGFWQQPGNGPPKDILNDLVAKITDAALQAAQNLQQADLFIGKTVLEGYTARYCNSEVLDDTMTILQAKDKIGNPIVTMANWGVHPTTMGADNTLISADYFWGYREEIKSQIGGGAMLLQGFIAAVQAGPNPIEGTGWDHVYNRGKVFADKVIQTLPQLNPMEGFYIQHLQQQYSSRVEGSYAILADGLGVFKRTKEYQGSVLIIPTLMATWHQIGNLEIASMPGEATPEYSLALRNNMISPFQFIVGLGMDQVGYIIDPDSIEKDDGTLQSYHLQMGFGTPIGPASWQAHKDMGYFIE